MRYLLISELSVDNFSEEIINFITDYIDKYHFKELHDKTPIFCLDCNEELFHQIRVRLHKKGLKFNDGLVTDTFFDKNKFLIDPIRAKTGSGYQIEFSLKLIRYDDSSVGILNEYKCDDVFIFSKEEPKELDVQDINLEQMDLADIKQIKFVMGMSKAYE